LRSLRQTIPDSIWCNSLSETDTAIFWRNTGTSIITDFGVSHRASGKAKHGKSVVEFHSELQVNSVALGQPMAANKQLESLKNGETQMNETKRSKKGVNNMSDKTSAARNLPWWCLFFILMAPLV
jgi:hypothetical protein